jgi:putative Mg2+ transporter-C (MgtC) family protein
MFYTPELILRILIGTLLGAVIGYERELRHRPAGLRTHLLVALSSATFMTISTHLVYYQHYLAADLIAEDPSRIAAAVVTGIGFLGGGAILRNGLTVQGMTTAASLWLVTAIGMTAGTGMYVESVSVTAIGMAVLTLLRRFEHDSELMRRKVVLTYRQSTPSVSELIAALNGMGVKVLHTELDQHFFGESKTKVILHVHLPSRRENEIVQYLQTRPDVRRLQVQSLG